MARSELGAQFARARNESLLTANAQRSNFLPALFAAMAQGKQQQMMPWELAARFLQPGGPVYTEGLAPSLIGAGGTLAGMAMMGSDGILKGNIRVLDAESYPFPLVEWDWNEEAAELGLRGSQSGFLAQDVEKVFPDLVIEVGGYKAILYTQLLDRLN